MLHDGQETGPALVSGERRERRERYREWQFLNSDGNEQKETNIGGKRTRVANNLSRGPQAQRTTGATRAPADRSHATDSSSEYVSYAPGPDREAMSARHGIDVADDEGQRPQPLKDESGQTASSGGPRKACSSK